MSRRDAAFKSQKADAAFSLPWVPVARQRGTRSMVAAGSFVQTEKSTGCGVEAWGESTTPQPARSALLRRKRIAREPRTGGRAQRGEDTPRSGERFFLSPSLPKIFLLRGGQHDRRHAIHYANTQGRGFARRPAP